MESVTLGELREELLKVPGKFNDHPVVIRLFLSDAKTGEVPERFRDLVDAGTDRIDLIWERDDIDSLNPSMVREDAEPNPEAFILVAIEARINDTDG